ncbi:ATL1 [Symbiodinium pilosum]|uniref:ATL1 protein n=1 Tax=Symbiodinium pilosum TaxID=2952 RepID=A0A812WJW0_SYMPI|nr:ATL1 [Symbiodinium pilosum]
MSVTCSWNSFCCVSGGADNTPLKILELKPDSSEVEILKENLDKISSKLHDSGASYVSIVAVMGTYRTGKSFLLDLLARYLKKQAAKEAAKERALEKARLDALTQAGGDYQRYVDQYAGDYEKYVGGGGSAGGAGYQKYYQKYMDQYGDYTKYMNGGQAGGNGYEQFMSQYAGKYMSDKSADKPPSGPSGVSFAATPTAQDADGSKASFADFQKYVQGAHGSDYAQYMNQHAQGTQGAGPGGFGKFMDQYAADYQKYAQSHGSQYSQGQGSQGSFTKYMDQYAAGHGASGGDFSQYMNKYAGDYTQQASGGGSDFQQYMDYQKYLHGQGGDYSKFMNQYAGDYSKYMGQGSSSGDYSKFMSDYANYQQYLKQGGSSAGDFSKYMQQYAGDYQKYLQGQASQGGGSNYQKYMDFKSYMNGQGGDFSQYMDKYASGMSNMAQGSGDADGYKKYMDFHKYMQGTSNSGDFSQYMSKYAADYQKFMQGQGQTSQGYGHSQSNGDHQSQYGYGSFQKSSGNATKGAAAPSLFVAESSQKPSDFKGYMGKYAADYQHYLESQGKAVPQGFQNFMGNYSDSFHKYMDARGSEAAGDFGKYFSEYQKFEQNKGKHASADFKHYMQGYADDYAKYLQERGESAASSQQSKSGNYQKYIAQYAGNYQKYMQDKPSASASSPPTFLAASGASNAQCSLLAAGPDANVAKSKLTLCAQDFEPGCKDVPVEEVGRKIKPLVDLLKAGGGVAKAPDAVQNKDFLRELDETFPELGIYKQGRIQTSPGVEEISGSPTEYYRTVGAIIALLSCYSSFMEEDFGLECVSAGERGPMSMDKVPGKFINMGNKKDDYKQFCQKFAAHMTCEDDWWGMLVFLVVHDVGKNDGFRKVVNDSLPFDMRSDDHDRCLACALADPELKRISFGLPATLRKYGEIACINFKGLLDLDRKHLMNGTLHYYFYHSIFDIAGAACNEKFIFPIAIQPVYMGFTAAMDDLIAKLVDNPKIDDRTLYFNFLYTNFKKAYPDFEVKFATMCESKVFCHETGLAVLRVLALTRNTYKNPEKVSELLLDEYHPLVQELAGSPVGPQIMLYYGPDMLRMGLGEDMADASGENMAAALSAIDLVYRTARRTLILAKSGDYQYQLNVSPIVQAIKKAQFLVAAYRSSVLESATEQESLRAELQAEKDRLATELKMEHAQRQKEKEHLRAELQAEQQQEQSQQSQAHQAQPAVLAQKVGTSHYKTSVPLLGKRLEADSDILVDSSEEGIGKGSSPGSCLNVQVCDSYGVVNLPERKGGRPFQSFEETPLLHHTWLLQKNWVLCEEIRDAWTLKATLGLKSLCWSEPVVAQADDSWRFGEEDRKKNKPPEWVLEGDPSRIHEGSKLDEVNTGFAWRPGKDKCTQGIWLWSHPFVFRDQDGRKIAVLLMDTQGAWDDTMTKAQSATIFGLTALLSSKLIYNIQNRVEEDKLENMDYITTFAQTVCSDLPGKDAPFGHLELLVRDWVNYEDGFSISECKDQMREHLDDHLSAEKVPEDAKPRVERLKSTFRSIAAWGLPHPGLKVTKPTYTGEIEVIDSDFLYLLDKFSEDFFGSGKFPQPSAPLGCEITTTGFQQVVMNFAKAFKENAQDMAIGLREAFVKVETVSVREDLHKRFRESLKKLAPESSVLDPQQLRHNLDGLLSRIVEEFKLKLKPWRMPAPDEEQVITDFEQVLTEAVQQRILVNDQQVEGGTLKLLASPVVGTGGYFLLAHHILLYVVVGGAIYFDANKHAQRESVELYNVKVLSYVWEDVQKWSVQRWKDIRPI